MTPSIEFKPSAINASECVGNSWSLIGANALLFIGMAFVWILLSILLSLIPYAGSILNLIISPPLLCGLLMAILTAYRGEQPRFSQLFEGFNRILPAILIQFVQALPWLIFSFGMLAYVYATNSSLISPTAAEPGTMPQFDLKVLVPFVVAYLAIFLVTIILKVLMFFAMPLIADHQNMGFVEAVKLSCQAAVSNIGGILLIILFEILFAIGGIACFCVGILFAMPLIYGLEIFAYKQVFPELFNDSNQEPPRPDAYGETYGYGR